MIIARDLVLPENDRGQVSYIRITYLIQRFTLISSSILQGSAHLILSVVDENDNLPFFTENFYTGTVREALPSASSVTVVSQLSHLYIPYIYPIIMPLTV